MLHIELLVEDTSGKIALDFFLRNILPEHVSFRIHSYRGIGRVPTNLKPKSDASKRILLNQLPRIITGYGRTFSEDAPGYKRVVAVICDLDERDEQSFRYELDTAIMSCNPKPETLILLSVEEGEAWLLGDTEAVVAAYPHVNKTELLKYIPDSICGTWERLADLVERGGSQALKTSGYQETGRAKSRWAHAIAPRVEPTRSHSPSFQLFVKSLGEVVQRHAN